MKNRNDSRPLKGANKKAQAALALAVSLWIANGGVASAENVINYEGTVPSLTKVTLGEFEWGTDAEILPTVWTDLAATEIDATGFEYTGKAINLGVASGSTSAILNAPGLTTRPVTGGTNKTVAVEDTDSTPLSPTDFIIAYLMKSPQNSNWNVLSSLLGECFPCFCKQ